MSTTSPTDSDATTDATTVDFRGQHLVVHQTGQGSPVGYLHGLLGNPSLHPFLTSLAQSGAGHRVIAPGLPGFSGSPACEDLRSMYDWVVATSEAVDLAGLAGAPFVASSAGAMLALEVAAVRPEAFERLVLIAPLGLWEPTDPVADPFGTTMKRQRSILTADVARTAAFFEDDMTQSPEVLIERNVDRYLARTAAASLVWPIPEFGLGTRIHRVTCPVTLVWGAQDELAPVSYLERFAELLPNVVGTHVVEGAGHLAEWDRPDEVAALVEAALS